MSFNGKLSIQLKLGPNSANRLDIELTRPALAEKVLLGLAPETAIFRLGQLLALCRQAQQGAATLALEHERPCENRLARLSDLIRAENIEQLLWRLMLDLPVLLDCPIDLLPYKEFRALFTQQASCGRLDQKNKQQLAWHTDKAFVQLTGLDAKVFLRLSTCQLEHWLAGSSLMAKALNFLPKTKPFDGKLTEKALLAAHPDQDLSRQLMDAMLIQADFCQQPCLDGETPSTGPMSYVCQHPHIQVMNQQKFPELSTFLLARIIYLAQLIEQLTGENESLPRLVGQHHCQDHRLAWVQSARGLLLHLGKLQDGAISDYRICAPTEWNFHRRGAFYRIMTDAEFRSNIAQEKQVKLAVLAFDPCIDFTIGVSHA